MSGTLFGIVPENICAPNKEGKKHIKLNNTSALNDFSKTQTRDSCSFNQINLKLINDAIICEQH